LQRPISGREGGVDGGVPGGWWAVGGGRASLVLSPADGALDVRNDEFGLCEVNNAKMDCYPEHARRRAVRPAVRGWLSRDRTPVEMTAARRGRPFVAMESWSSSS